MRQCRERRFEPERRRRRELDVFQCLTVSGVGPRGFCENRCIGIGADGGDWSFPASRQAGYGWASKQRGWAGKRQGRANYERGGRSCTATNRLVGRSGSCIGRHQLPSVRVLFLAPIILDRAPACGASARSVAWRACGDARARGLG
jgi:hypothetical protein